MSGNEKIRQVDIASLEIIHYPDPRLRENCTPIEDPSDPAVAKLVEKMFEMMFASSGVGLAAPQVGVTVRLFIASPSFSPDDRRVYINPEIVSLEGTQDGEEGCLSFPGISCKIKRANKATISAADLSGEQFEEDGEELTARIFQHESDHLDGRLLVDRMGTIAKLGNRKSLKRLEEDFEE